MLFEKTSKYINKKNKESKVPKSIEEIDKTLREMDKIHNTSFYEWIKDENNAGVIAFKTKNLFQENYKTNPEIVYNVLRFLCKDWKLSKVAEIILKLFYKCNIASKEFAEIVCEVSFLMKNPEKVDLISLLLIGEESKNVAYFLYYYFKHTEKRIRSTTEITDKDELLDELNAFCAGVLECLYTCFKWNEDYFRELLLNYVLLSTSEDDDKRDFLVRMVNVKYQRFQKDLQNEIRRKKNMAKIIDCVEDTEIDRFEEMEEKLEEENKLLKKSIDFGILIFNMFQTVMRTEIDELTTLSTPVSETPPSNILKDNSYEKYERQKDYSKETEYTLNREESDSTLYIENEMNEINNSSQMELRFNNERYYYGETEKENENNINNDNGNNNNNISINNCNNHDTEVDSDVDNHKYKNEIKEDNNKNYGRNDDDDDDDNDDEVDIDEEEENDKDDDEDDDTDNEDCDIIENDQSYYENNCILTERRPSSLRIIIPTHQTTATPSFNQSNNQINNHHHHHHHHSSQNQNHNLYHINQTSIPNFRRTASTTPQLNNVYPTTLVSPPQSTTINIIAANPSTTVSTTTSLLISPLSSYMVSPSPLSLTLVSTSIISPPPSPVSSLISNSEDDDSTINDTMATLNTMPITTSTVTTTTTTNTINNSTSSSSSSIFQYNSTRLTSSPPNYNQILLKDESNNNNTIINTNNSIITCSNYPYTINTEITINSNPSSPSSSSSSIYSLNLTL